MAFRLTPVTALLGVAGALGLYALLAPSASSAPQNTGESARVGDEVFIPVTSLPAGALPAALPAGAGYIVLRISTASQTELTGSIVAYVLQQNPPIRLPITPPIGPISVQRAMVTNVSRNGALVA